MSYMENAEKTIRKIEWDDNGCLNVPVIDENHKIFLKTINKVIDLVNKHDTDREQIAIILYEMTMYSINHLKSEEDLMRKIEYSEYQSHHEEHNYFIKRTVEFCNRTMDGDYEITDDLLEYLQMWLVKHIQGADKKLTSLMQTNNQNVFQEEQVLSC